MIQKVANNRSEHIIGIALLIALFLPHISTPLLLVNPIMCLLLFIYFRNKRCAIPLTGKILFIIALLLSFIANFAFVDVSSKSLVSFVNILLVLVCFPIVGNYKIRNIYFYIAALYIILSQFAMFLHIPFLSTLYDILYPIGDDKEAYFDYVAQNASLDTVSSFRLSGLFRNPNQCAKFTTILFSAFVLENKNKPILKLIPFIVISAFSVLMTGSRTGLVIFSVILICGLWSNSTVTRKQRNFVLLGILGAFIALIISESNFRGLKIEEGFNDSAGSKFKALLDYLGNDNGFIHLLFGNFDPELFSATSANVINSLDSEYGYVIFNYGIVSFIAYIAFFVSVKRKLNKHDMIILIPLLWIVSSTILLAYRPIMVYLILLSKYLVRSTQIS